MASPSSNGSNAINACIRFYSEITAPGDRLDIEVKLLGLDTEARENLLADLGRPLLLCIQKICVAESASRFIDLVEFYSYGFGDVLPTDNGG